MAITAEQVKALREKTGAGMMECKAALTESSGEMEAAVDLLRKRGLAQAAKKAGRSTSEGLIGSYLSPDAKVGALVEVNCESDFVARTDDFQRLIREVAEDVAEAGDAGPAWIQDPKGPVGTKVTAAIAKLGENITVSRAVRFAGNGVIGQYIHLGGKIGVMVEVTSAADVAPREEFKTLVKEIAMQVAAASPAYASRSEVPADVLEREKSVYRGQLEGQNKPANVLDKIIEGKLGSFYQQVVLPDQPSIRDPKVSVAQMIGTAATSLGTSIEVTRFVRLRVGETA